MHKLRVKFTKTGPIKFIGHLDVMRYFQKAIRRAEIDIKYSEGFSPHQVISFAQPLSVGATSEGEYMDMSVNSMESSKDIKNRLSSVCNEGIDILAVTELPENEDKAMTLTYAAKYRVKIRESLKPDFDWVSEFEKYLENKTLPAMKKTKSGEKEIDMKPMIFDCSFDHKGESVVLLLSMSSMATLKPALLFEGFYKSKGLEFTSNALDLHRIDIYKKEEDDKGEYIIPFICDKNQEKIYL
ncbi:TIGR03936 family radical SAM-associated protein [Butyrivibrio proteoclasticus]|uniref:TIGR03936 family radical SAM-associated protein n=1 Tax=Butyrivibrio proteoclasticus TaxID=43305 RepID=UPI000557F4D2|nr:TIGR03936 family radical SAM-associated protein [Butyrivibrio proteoclasticus]